MGKDFRLNWLGWGMGKGKQKRDEDISRDTIIVIK